jgi:preprotein translocase subunit Sec61beta
MSSKRKKEAPLPASSAGLLSFFADEGEQGVKIRPEIVLSVSIALIIISIVINQLFK